MNYLSIQKTKIYSATKNEKIKISLWNRTDHDVTGLFICGGSQTFNNEDCMVVGAPNEFPDTEHEIDLLEGESIIAKCNDEKSVEYQISI